MDTPGVNRIIANCQKLGVDPNDISIESTSEGGYSISYKGYFPAYDYENGTYDQNRVEQSTVKHILNATGEEIQRFVNDKEIKFD